jgi:hypothetical protein
MSVTQMICRRAMAADVRFEHVEALLDAAQLFKNLWSRIAMTALDRQVGPR